MRPPSRVSALLTGLLVATLGLAACSGGGEEEPTAEPTTVTTTTDEGDVVEVPPEPETWPLTGMEVKGGGEAATEHPVMVVKMDNTPSSAPQVGLSQADLVVEELVEGGVTRLAAFYYSTIPGEVGPVRSMRASDIGIVTPAKGTVVTSGAAPVTINRINGAGITFFGEGSKGVYRKTDRYAPYNLFANIQDVSAVIEQDSERPDDYLPFGDAKDNPKGVRASTLEANFGNHTTSWRFEQGRYVNVDSFAGSDDQFPADSVLVLRVQIGDAGYTDPAGYPVPETKFVGKGEAMLFTGGTMVKGTWSKKQLTAPLTLSTKKGDLVVPPGRTWIELVPAGTGSVSFAR